MRLGFPGGGGGVRGGHAAALVLGLASLGGCVTERRFDEELTALRTEVDAARRENQALRMRLDDLAPRLDAAAEAVAAGGEERASLMDRVVLLEADHARVQALEKRLADIEGRLSTQRGRLASLLEELGALREMPPMHALTRLEKDVADLSGRVSTNERLAQANEEKIDGLTKRADAHEAEFERQMRLLGEYVQQQFVPLAEGLVSFLYEESRRMGQNAQQLEEFARRVDPYKFTHLHPGYVEPEPTSTDTGGDDDQ